jgi:ABC-2 type transport system permease protein
VLLGWGRFDFAFVVIYLLPLLIAGFGCVALSADHESRVLQIVLSQPVSASRLAMLRVILRGGLLVLATLLGLAGGLLLGQADLTGSSNHLVWFITIIFFYSIFWCALALWITSFGRSSETNAVIMVIIWAVVVLIAPAINTFVARSISPMPSRLEYIVATREAENDANRGGRELLQNYLLDHPELEATRGDAVSPFIKTFFLVQRQVELVIAPIVARFEEAEDAQQRTREALRRISPRDIASESLLLSTGNGGVRFADFERQARELRANWARTVESAVIAGRRLTADEFIQLPRPQFREVARAEFFRRHGSSVFILLLFSFIVSIDALRRLKNFSPAQA